MTHCGVETDETLKRLWEILAPFPGDCGACVTATPLRELDCQASQACFPESLDTFEDRRREGLG